MPRKPEDNDRIRLTARDKIQSAAMEIFIEKGYHHATMEDIAIKAGISKGLPYNYFKGKEGVLSEMVRSRIEEIRIVMETAVSQGSPAEQLDHIIEGALNNVQQCPKAFRFFLHLQTQPEDDLVLAKYSQMLNNEVVSQFELQCDVFARLGVNEPRLRSLYFSSCLQGVMLMISTYPEQFPVQSLMKQLRDEFLSGHQG